MHKFVGILDNIASIHYKPTDTHSYLHHDSSHPRHCKESLLNSQFLRLRRLCSDNADFVTKAQEMASFFERRGYNPETLKIDLEKMKDLSQTKALTKNTLTKEKMNRIPFVLTYHPLNNRIKRILLDNFKVITDDPATRQIFPNQLIVAYRRDKNLRTSLVHTADMQATTRAGSHPCEHSRCRTCGHISSDINFGGQRTPLPSRNRLLVRPLELFIASPAVAAPPFNLRSINKSAPGFPVAEHFSSNGHTATDAQVRSVKLCGGNKQRKRQEMRLIFQLGTCQPRGLNFISTEVRAHAREPERLTCQILNI